MQAAEWAVAAARVRDAAALKRSSSTVEQPITGVGSADEMHATTVDAWGEDQHWAVPKSPFERESAAQGPTPDWSHARGATPNHCRRICVIAAYVSAAGSHSRTTALAGATEPQSWFREQCPDFGDVNLNPG